MWEPKSELPNWFEHAEGQTHQKCVWLQSNSITELDSKQQPTSCEIKSVRACGNASYFKDVASTPQQKVPHPSALPKPSSTRIVPAAAVTFRAATVPVPSATAPTTESDDDYFLKKMKTSVKWVSFIELLQAMRSEGLVGVDTCRNKDDLIRLMVEKNYSYTVPVNISSDSSDTPPPKKTPRPTSLPPHASQKNIHFEWVNGPIGWFVPGSATEVVPGSAEWALKAKANVCVWM